MATFAGLRIPFPLFEAPISEASEYAGMSTCLVCNGPILDLGHVICLDTNCVGGGWLTGMDVGTRQVWQADERGRLRL